MIKYVTKQPSATDFSGHAEMGVSAVQGGNQSGSARGSVNIPLVNEKVGVSLCGFYRDDPRWMNNVHASARGTDLNKKEFYGYRGALVVKPIDKLSFTLTALQQRFKSEFSERGGTNLVAVCAACVPARNTQRTTFDLISGGYDDLSVAFSDGDVKNRLFTGRIDYDFDWATFTSLTAYNKALYLSNSDVTFQFGSILLPAYNLPTTGGTSVGIVNRSSTKKYSQEFRLASPTGQKAEWLVGAFMTQED